MTKNVCVITDRSETIAELVSSAKSFGETVTLFFAGDAISAVGADRAYHIGDLSVNSFINYSSSIVEKVCEEQPGLVLVSSSKNGRLIAGMIAAAVGTTVFTDISELTQSENGITSKRMVYGGKAVKKECSIHSTVVVCLGSGIFQPVELLPIENICELESNDSVKFIEKRRKTGKTINLSAAKRIVCAGRGIGSEENLVLLKKFGEQIGAELGCTRPIAEEEKWLPTECYIGVSGVMLKPEFYLGAGVSGQIQHTVGINQSGVVFAINKDANAPIFSQCDYGLISDIKDILPRLLDEFK